MTLIIDHHDNSYINNIALRNRNLSEPPLLFEGNKHAENKEQQHLQMHLRAHIQVSDNTKLLLMGLGSAGWARMHRAARGERAVGESNGQPRSNKFIHAFSPRIRRQTIDWNPFQPFVGEIPVYYAACVRERRSFIRPTSTKLVDDNTPNANTTVSREHVPPPRIQVSRRNL